MERQSDKIPLRQLLLQNGLWLKKSSECANSLMRAVSVCLYFTDRYKECIRKLVVSYFQQRYASCMTTEGQKKAMERYYENNSLLEFESINLEIISRLFNVEVRVYFIEDGRLQWNNHSTEGVHQIKIIRMAEMNYAGLFTTNFKTNCIFAQNIALSLVDAVLSSNSYKYNEPNNGKLINFDYKKWLAQSNPVQTIFNSFHLIDYNLYLLNGPNNVSSSKNQHLRNEDQFQKSNIGLEIVSLFQKRKKSIQTLTVLPNCSQQNFIIENFAHQKIFLSTSHCSVSLRKSMSVKKAKLEKSTSANRINSLLGDSFETDSNKTNVQYCGGLVFVNTSKEKEIGEEQGESSTIRKSSNGDDFSAFKIEKDFIELGHDKNLQIFESKIVQEELTDSNSGGLNRMHESKNTFKPSKESLKEKLMKKQNSNALKIELTKNFSFQEMLVNPSKHIQSAEKTTPFGSSAIKIDPSQKLISELKSGQSNKEKYSETIENRIYQGFLKFFDEKNGFGFFQIGKENEWEDVFVYKSEFDKANIKTDSLKNLKSAFSPTFSFQIAIYFVNNDRRKKAINIKLV